MKNKLLFMEEIRKIIDGYIKKKIMTHTILTGRTINIKITIQ